MKSESIEEVTSYKENKMTEITLSTSNESIKSGQYEQSDTTNLENGKTRTSQQNTDLETTGTSHGATNNNNSTCIKVGNYIFDSLVTVVSTLMIFAGVYFLNDCHVSIMIPVWMIVAGSLGIANTIGFRTKYLLASRKKDTVVVDNSLGVLALIIILWLIVGIGLVYGVLGRVELAPTKPVSSNVMYCSQHLYFWSITSVTAGMTFVVTKLLIVCFNHDWKQVVNK